MTKRDEQLLCEWCNGPILNASPLGRPAKFCSPSHRQRAWEKRSMDARVEKRAKELNRRRAK